MAGSNCRPSDGGYSKSTSVSTHRDSRMLVSAVAHRDCACSDDSRRPSSFPRTYCHCYICALVEHPTVDGTCGHSGKHFCDDQCGCCGRGGLGGFPDADGTVHVSKSCLHARRSEIRSVALSPEVPDRADQADAVFSYQLPFNIVAVIFMLPMSYILNARWFHKLNGESHICPRADF